MEQGGAGRNSVDSVSPELLNLLIPRGLQIIEGLIFEMGITTVRRLQQLSSNPDHKSRFEEVVERIRKCASIGLAIEFKMLGEASSSLEDSYVSDQRPVSCGALPSSDLSKALARSRLKSVECFLRLKLGLHSLECLRRWAFHDVRLLDAGYGPGHVERLKLLHQKVCGQSATRKLSPGGAHREKSLTLGDSTEYQTSLVPAVGKGEAASSIPWTRGPQHIQRFQAKLLQALSLLSKLKVSSTAPQHEEGLLFEVKDHLRILQESPKDAGDEHAAKALELIDTLWPDPKAARDVKCIFRDIILLACTRNVNPKSKAILQDRLRAAFGRHLDPHLLSKLLNTRKQLFEIKRRNRANEQVASPPNFDDTRGVAEPEPYTSLQHSSLSSGMTKQGLATPPGPAQVSNFDQAEIVKDVVAYVLPAGFEGFKIERTFIEKNSEVCSWSKYANSETDLRTQKWSRKTRRYDLPYRQHEEAELVMGYFSERFDQKQMKSIKRMWAELFACRDMPQLQQNVHISYVVEATEQLIQSGSLQYSTVAHCCKALSQLAVSKVEVAERVVSIIVNVVGDGVLSVYPSELLRIFEAHKVVLQVATSTSKTIEEHQGMLLTMQKLLSAHEDERVRSECVRVLARCQRLPDLLGVLGDDKCLWHVALDEVYKGLDQQLAWSFWPAPDDDVACASEADMHEKHITREVLLMVSSQLGSSLETCPSSATLVRWAGSKTDKQVCRFKFIGILFGVQRALLDPLFAALDFAQQHGHLDETYITTIFRALIELEFLGLVPLADADRIVLRISDKSVILSTNSCVCAFVSVLASLGRQSTDFDAVKMILEIGNCYANYYRSSCVLYECLWALSILLNNLDAAHTLDAIEFAEKVLDRYREWSDPSSWASCRGDECKAWRLANILLATWRELSPSAEEGSVSESTVESAHEVTMGLHPWDEADSDES